MERVLWLTIKPSGFSRVRGAGAFLGVSQISGRAMPKSFTWSPRDAAAVNRLGLGRSKPARPPATNDPEAGARSSRRRTRLRHWTSLFTQHLHHEAAEGLPEVHSGSQNDYRNDVGSRDALLAWEHRFRGLYPGRIVPAKQFQLGKNDRLLDRSSGRKAGIMPRHWRIPQLHIMEKKEWNAAPRHASG